MYIKKQKTSSPVITQVQSEASLLARLCTVLEFLKLKKYKKSTLSSLVTLSNSCYNFKKSALSFSK